jgi:endoglucanase
MATLGRRRIWWVLAGLALASVAVIILLVPRPGDHSSPSAPPWQDTASNRAVFPGGLWVNPKSQPATQVLQLRASGQTASAAAVATIASQPIATWLTGSVSGEKLVRLLRADLTAAKAAGTTPVFVTYAIPDRDCGDYSAGGIRTAAAYKEWNATIAGVLRGHPAVVLMEPDSIAMLGAATCTSATAGRLALLDAVARRYASDHIDVYLDGGNSHWRSPQVMATRLRQAGIAYARGFFTNVSNFYRVDAERRYASSLSALVGNKHFVIDVSRDGAGPRGSWCNPTGAALGQDPHVTAGTTKLDALLWVKTPGASDGTCNSGPAAGQWYASYALALVANRGAR